MTPITAPAPATRPAPAEPTTPQRERTASDVLLAAARYIEEHGWHQGSEQAADGRVCMVYRAWFRQNRWADWPAERGELDRELRALVSLLRKARAIAAAKPDPMTLAGFSRSLHDREGWPS